MAKQSLKDKTIKGTIWSTVDNVSQYLVTFIVGIVLARLLTPDDYGLIGLISIFTAICTKLINSGFTSSLIRKKDATEDDYNTVFIINFGVSILLYIVLYFCAPFISQFFGREELTLLTRVSSLGLIISALAIVQRTRLTKKVNFKSQTKITVIASVTSGVVGIVMAVIGYGVWSLVAQHLVLQVLTTVLLWVKNKWVPNLRFSVSSFKELFGFGWKMMLAGLLETIWKELYQVIIGKFYQPAALGQYTRAKQFAHLLSSNLTNVIQRVTFPVLSNIQDDKVRMVSAYRRIIKVSMFITAVSMFALAGISKPLIYCLLGEKWNEAALYLPFMCVSMSLYPLQAINLNMLMVQGRSDLFLALEIVKKIVVLFPLFVGAFVGIIPMLIVNIFTSVICYFLNSYYSGKFLGYSTWMQLKDVAPSYFVALIVALSIWFFQYMPVSNWIILPIQIIFGVVVFFAICKAMNLSEYKELKQIALSVIYKKK